jgi:hypothetical protein
MDLRQFQAFEQILETLADGADEDGWDSDDVGQHASGTNPDLGRGGSSTSSGNAGAAAAVGGAGGGGGAFFVGMPADTEEEGNLAHEIDLFSKKLSTYIQRKVADEDEVAELRAIVMMTGRSLQRRVDGGMFEGGGLRAALRDQLHGQMVEREGLISEEDWLELFSPTTPPAKVESPAAKAKAQGGAREAVTMSPAEIAFELKARFPALTGAAIMSAAQGSKSLVLDPRPWKRDLTPQTLKL